MNTRRYHITKAEGETIKLALASLIQELKKILTYESNDPYWHYQLERAKTLKHNLDCYNWNRE